MRTIFGCIELNLFDNKGIAFAVYFKEVHADVGVLPFKITTLLQDEHSIPYCD